MQRDIKNSITACPLGPYHLDWQVLLISTSNHILCSVIRTIDWNGRSVQEKKKSQEIED